MDGAIMLLHGYLQQNKGVIGNFISYCAKTISIQRRPTCRINGGTGGSVSRQYLPLYLIVFGLKIHITHSGSILKYLVIYANSWSHCFTQINDEKWNILLNLLTIVYGAWTARSVSVPGAMNQMDARDYINYKSSSGCYGLWKTSSPVL